MKKVLIIELIALSLVVTLLTGAVGYACMRDAWQEPEPTVETAPPIQAKEPAVEITVIEEDVDDSWLGNVDPARSLASGLFFVYAVEDRQFLVSSHAAETQVYPASVTKLLTALVAMEYLDPEEMIVAGDELDMLDPDSSLAGISKGDCLSAVQLVEAMMLPSGNDAAHIIAAAAGRKILSSPTAPAKTAVVAFVEEMNRYAADIGMKSSHFVTPDGIHDAQHYTTIGDLTVLGRRALNSVLVRSYSSLATGNNPRYDETNTQEGAPRQWRNTNALLHPESVYYCPYAIGLKTGQTNAAGICLLSAFQYRGEYYLVGVFRGPSSDDRFADTLQLFAKYVYNQ